MKKNSIALFTILISFSISFVFMFLKYNSHKIESNDTMRTFGIVISKDDSVVAENGFVTSYTIEYLDSSNRKIQFTNNFSYTFDNRYEKGDSVRVIYSKSNPEIVTIDSFIEINSYIIGILVPSLILLIGVFIFVKFGKNQLENNYP